MNYQEQAELIWGSHWNWHETLPNQETAQKSFLLIKKKLYTDMLVFVAFVEFVLDRIGLDDTDLCVFYGCEWREEEHPDDFKEWYQTHTHSVKQISDMVLCWDYYKYFMFEGEGFDLDRLTLPPGDKYLSNYAVERTAPALGRFSLLSLFEPCGWWSTINNYCLKGYAADTESTKQEEKSGSEFKTLTEEEIKELASERILAPPGLKPSEELNENSNIVLLVDPRIPLMDTNRYIKAEEHARKEATGKIIMTPSELLEQSDKVDEIIEEWNRLRDELFSNFGKEPSLPYEYQEALSDISHGRELFQKGRDLLQKGRDSHAIKYFSDAIVVFFKACERLLRKEFDLKDSQVKQSFADILYKNKTEIENRYGKAIYSDLMDIKDKRNKLDAAHPGKKPTETDVKEVHDRAGLVYRKFSIFAMKYRKE